jgi:hypothetical protein
MASVRLKKEHKIEIHDRVLADAAKERMEKLRAHEHQLGKALYLHVIKGHGASIQAVPRGFYQGKDSIGVDLFKTEKTLKDGRNKTAYHQTTLSDTYEGYNTVSHGKFYNSNDNLEIGEEVRMPHNYMHGNVQLLFTDDLGVEVLALIKEQELLKDNLVKLSETVQAALLECTTVKKLVDNYPELKPYAPADIANQAMAVAHGRIEGLITCTKKTTCDDDKPKRKSRAKKAGVIAL